MEIMDKPIYLEDYLDSGIDYYSVLMNDLEWKNYDAPRNEYFMALKEIEYSYDVRGGVRTYVSNPFHPLVLDILDKLNSNNDGNSYGPNGYNVCFLNHYENEKHHLGWHSDDSPSMDMKHPIASISLYEDTSKGSVRREIWWKDKEMKGVIPDSNKVEMDDGSIFIMPSDFQYNHYHRIPKCDRACMGRISLTFRRYEE